MQIEKMIEFLEENDVNDAVLSDLGVRNVEQLKGRNNRDARIIRANQIDIQVQHKDDLEMLESGFNFSYTPSRHEASWLFSSIGQFYVDQWFSDILRIAKGGKEASVYLCQANPHVEVPLLAAKVYRPRQFRNLRKDHVYREGRDVLDGEGHVIIDDGSLQAIRKKTDFGKKLVHSSWIDYEVKTLETLNRVGGDVPKIFAHSDMAILMEFIGDEYVSAPMLQEVELMSHEALPLFERTIHNIELMLENQIVHGDLSAYNILYWEGDIVLIDFPQVVSPFNNPNAYRIFRRDVQRVCDYFSRQGVRCDGPSLADQLWKHYRFPETATVPVWMMKLEEEDQGNASKID